MQRYSQATLVHPTRTLVVWLAVAILVVLASALRGLDVTGGDLPRIIGGVAIAIAVASLLVSRSWQGVVATLVVVLVAAGITLSFADLVGAAVSPILVIVGVAALGVQLAGFVGSAHAARIHRERTRTPPRPLPRDRRYLLSEALRDVRGSIVWSTATTCVVFGVIYLAGTGGLASFAGVMVIGTLTTAIAASTILPAIYASAPVEVPERRDMLAKVAGIGARLPAVAILVVGIAAIVVGIVASWELASGALRAFAFAIVALWAMFCLGFGSLRRGTLALVPTLPAVMLGGALVRLRGDALDATTAAAGALALALATHHTIRVFKSGILHQRRNPNAERQRLIEAMLEEVGPSLVLSSIAVGLTCAALVLSEGTVSAGIVLLAVTGGAFAWHVLGLPAMVALCHTRRTRPASRPQDWEFIEKFSKVTGAEQSGITSFADYTDDQIRNMFVGDFFALCGKTVMRHGGTHGTRRLLTELDIAPRSKILEIGTGVGTTSFDLVAADPTIHVTSVDLSVFMIEATRKRAEEYSRQWRALHPDADASADPGARQEFIHTDDPNVMPFPDNTFDAVIVEAVASYNDPPKFFREILRVLKPGGRMGLHDWCWTEQPSEKLEVEVCVLACGCNPGEMQFFTHADWSRALTTQGFEIRFAEEYPFTFFSWGTMADDEGTWLLLKMFARVFARRAILDRMLRMMLFLMRHEGAFGYTITVAGKPQIAHEAAVPRSSVLPEPPAIAGPQPEA